MVGMGICLGRRLSGYRCTTTVDRRLLLQLHFGWSLDIRMSGLFESGK